MTVNLWEGKLPLNPSSEMAKNYRSRVCFQTLPPWPSTVKKGMNHSKSFKNIFRNKTHSISSLAKTKTNISKWYFFVSNKWYHDTWDPTLRSIWTWQEAPSSKKPSGTSMLERWESRFLEIYDTLFGEEKKRGSKKFWWCDVLIGFLIILFSKKSHCKILGLMLLRKPIWRKNHG